MRAYEAELKNCPYAKSTLYCANLNPELVTWLQTACEAICGSSKPQPIQIPQQYAVLPVSHSAFIRHSFHSFSLIPVVKTV